MSSHRVASTSHDSSYVDDAYYDAIIQRREAAQSLGPSDNALRAEAEQFLFHEARLIDSGGFEAWLDLYADECLYWVPIDDSADPRRTVNIAFDDRRRLEDRIARLRSGFAHNQVPMRSIQHHISNVEAWHMEADGSRRILSNQIIYEHRVDRPLITYRAKVDHRLIDVQGQWLVAEKRVVLINSQEAIETPTLL